MFGNNFNSPFGYNSMPTATQPYGYPMVSYPQTQPQQTPQTNTNKIYVTGIDDVRNRMLPTSSDYVFLDNDKPLLYQKIVDSKGQFDVKVFDIIPHVEKPESDKTKDFVPRSEFTALQNKIANIEDAIAMLIPTKQEDKTDGTNN